MTNPEIHGMIGIFHRRSKSCEIISFMWEASPNSYKINPSCSLGCSADLCANGKGKDAQSSSCRTIWYNLWGNILLMVFPLGKKNSLSCRYNISARKQPGTEITGFKVKVRLLQVFKFLWKVQIKGLVRRYFLCDSYLNFCSCLYILSHGLAKHQLCLSWGCMSPCMQTVRREQHWTSGWSASFAAHHKVWMALCVGDLRQIYPLVSLCSPCWVCQDHRWHLWISLSPYYLSGWKLQIVL